MKPYHTCLYLLLLLGCDQAGVPPASTASSKTTANYISVDDLYSNTKGTILNNQDAFIFIGSHIPHFGGLYFNPQGRLIVSFNTLDINFNRERDLNQVNMLIQDLPILAASLEGHLVADDIEHTDFSFLQLSRYMALLSQNLNGADVVSYGVRESASSLYIQVFNISAIQIIEEILAELSIPLKAVKFEIISEYEYTNSLNKKFRPTTAGIQISDADLSDGGVCTLGFNLMYTDILGLLKPGFMTNSHCTQTSFYPDDSQYAYQPSPNNYIGYEIDDPQLSSNLLGCPANKSCRYSDAALFTYAGSVSGSFTIARPSAPNQGILSVTLQNPSDRFTVTQSYSPLEGSQINKVGKSTGWSSGVVMSDCQTVAAVPSNPNAAFLCQTVSTYDSFQGDSGAPVFRIISNNNVALNGIHWGRGKSDGSQESSRAYASGFTEIKRDFNFPNWITY